MKPPLSDDERHARRLASLKKYRETHKAQCTAYSRAKSAARSAIARAAWRQPPASKICAGCGVDKPLGEYGKRRSTGERQDRGAGGVPRLCKACRSRRRKPTLVAERAERIDLQARGMKRCTKCRRIQPLCRFSMNRAAPDGIATRCKSCVDVNRTAWNRAHPNAFREWDARNKEHRDQYKRDWREAHVEHRSDSYRQWAKANPHKVAAVNMRRYVAKRNASPKWADQRAIQAFYAEAARLTKVAGIRHEVDHIIPIRSATVCGLHVPANLQILTSLENKRKRNHYDAFSSGALDLARDLMKPASNAFRLSTARKTNTLAADLAGAASADSSDVD